MATANEKQTDDLAHLVALAAKLESVGQYNVAKLLRGAADSIVRRAAYDLDLPTDPLGLKEEVGRAAAVLSGQKADPALVAALEQAGEAVAEGRLPRIEEAPHPYVCYTCGFLALGQPPDHCPTCGARPATFVRFLPMYWLDALEPFEALERLKQTPRDTAALIEDLPEALLGREPESGGWSMRQIVTHMKDAEGVLNFRLNLMLEQDHPVLKSTAVFEWAGQEADRPPTTQEIYNLYQRSRQKTIDKLEGIPLEAWWRTGQNEEFGPVTIRQQVSYFATHECTHLPQLERGRQNLAGVER